ncbi:MAG: hypothetical protein K4571_14100 [Deltaproteobacteria bacterium]
MSIAGQTHRITNERCSFSNKTSAETIGELAALPLEALIKAFGVSCGRCLFEAARGIDESPIVTHRKPKSISREKTFQKTSKTVR